MLHQWLGVRQKALSNIHRTAMGVRDPCITLAKCNDVFRQNTFYWVRIVSNASSAQILLISDDRTVSVRGMKRWPERFWQKYRLNSNICNTDLTVCPWKWAYYLLCTVSVSTKGFPVQCDELSYSRPSKSNVQRNRGKPGQKQRLPLPPPKPGPSLHLFQQNKKQPWVSH